MKTTKKIIQMLIILTLSISAPAKNLLSGEERKSILSFCEFFNLSGELIRNYPGLLCAPFSNGNLALATEKKLMLLDRNNKVVWSKDIPVHHQLKITKDEKYILALASRYEKTESKGENRFDQIYIISPDGKIESQFEFNQKTFRDWKVEHLNKEDDWSPARNLKSKTIESSHLNSIAEMEDKQGYVVANAFPPLLFFFDKGLKEIIKKVKLKSKVHDASMKSKDEVIFYQNNSVWPEAKSVIGVLDLKTNETKHIYGEEDFFFSDARGSVQVLDNNKLFISHSLTDGKPYTQIVDYKTREQKKIILKSTVYNTIQTATLSDFSKFLKNNRGN